MAKDDRLVGESLMGMGRDSHRRPNTYPIWKYLLILLIVGLGVIYALPTLYQPDNALQIGSQVDIGGAASISVGQQQLDKALAALDSAGIQPKGAALTDAGAQIRFQSSEDQLQANELVAQSLGGEESGFVVALNKASNTPEWLEDLGGKPISLGLDLSGGAHFLLQVDMDKFLGDLLKTKEVALKEFLAKEKIRFVGRNWLKGDRIEVGFRSEAFREQAQTIVAEQFPEFLVQERDVDGQPGLILSHTDEEIRAKEDFAIDQNLQSLRNRVNELGVSEPLVQRLGRSRIVVDLPGVQDSTKAKGIINKFANLEFRLVAPPGTRSGLTESLPYEGRNITLLRKNIVTGNQVTNAQQDFDPESGRPQVSINLDNAGGRMMNEATKDNIGNQMAVLFKELKTRFRTVVEEGVSTQKPYTEEIRRLINVATIQDALGFRFRITGLELDEARQLSLLLRAGALAAPMYIAEERTVGASLGEENIAKGRQSVMVGFGLVLLFMVIYYKGFGLAANVALTANLVLIVAVMSILGATLTMPGIAGIVLTVGMAVDANVLIFSRIREELKDRPPQQAIQAGFDRALLTILDANITTFFVAVILFSVGSGPVKGFAITLAVGIVTSVFTAIMVTRALVNLFYGGRTLEKVVI